MPDRILQIGPHDQFLLAQWGRQLREAFGVRAYVVGSVMERPNFRDVDVRLLAPDWLAAAPARFRRTLNMTMSMWGRQVTGLPIDFQAQLDEEFHSYDTHVRGAMGVQLDVGFHDEADDEMTMTTFHGQDESEGPTHA